MSVARKRGDLLRNMDSYAVLHFIYHGATSTVGRIDWACACGIYIFTIYYLTNCC